MLRTKEPTPEDKKLQEQVAMILADHQSEGGSDVLKRLTSFLTTPVESRSAFSLGNLGSNEDSSQTANKVGTIVNVITSLLRLFVFR
jgi:hypothetical protein